MESSFKISVGGDTAVSAIAQVPANARCCLVFAHGAGAGMDHPYLAAVARGLDALGVATLRYQFPYRERRSSRPDRPEVCHRTVRAAVGAARELLPAVPLFAGGKSFGGRMTSQAQADAPLPGVLGLCFFGFPLHLPKKISMTRAEHLSSIDVPTLFLQGTRDPMAERESMRSVIDDLGPSATLYWVPEADHAFHVLKRSGTTDSQVMQDMLETVAEWTGAIMGKAAS